jgi:hypothetical protein
MVNGSAFHLNAALLEHPRLLDDFPYMITALDRGEHVNVGAISDVGFRDALISVFQCLPVAMEHGRGFYKSQGVKSIGGFLLMDLLDQKAIKQPSRLSTEQNTLGPLHLLSLFRDHPSDRTSVLSAMRRLSKRKCLECDDFDKIGNSKVKEQLRRVLIAIGAYENDDGDICLPEKKTNKVNIAFKEMMKCVMTVFDRSSKREAKKNREDSDKSSENSDSETSSNEDERKEDVPDPSTKIDIGPALPTASEMQKNQQLSKSFVQKEMDLDEDDYGPLPASAAAAAAVATRLKAEATAQARATSSVPLGVIPTTTPSNGSNGGSKKRKVGNESMREDWMLSPGDNAGIAAMNQVFDEDGVVKLNKAGKFNTSKAASTAARELQEKKREVSGGSQNPVDAAADAMLREYNELRGPSLMAQHMSQMDAKMAAKKATKGGPRDGFDYDRDIVNSRRGTNSKARDELVKEAQLLSSRFDRSVQR